MGMLAPHSRPSPTPSSSVTIPGPAGPAGCGMAGWRRGGNPRRGPYGGDLSLPRSTGLTTAMVGKATELVLEAGWAG